MSFLSVLLGKGCDGGADSSNEVIIEAAGGFRKSLSVKAANNFGGKVAAEYVWLGGMPQNYFCGLDIRCKTKTLDAAPKSLDELPIWNYDGSSTDQAPGTDSEVLLKPVAMFTDPFRGAPHILVMCESVVPVTMAPATMNERAACAEVMAKFASEKPWFGIEQEYTLFKKGEEIPLGFPDKGEPKRGQGPYYCGAGDEVAFGRAIVEEHYAACLEAGLTIAGLNAEVMPGQWEYQVGPCEGMDSGDHMWISRYIMLRVCEKHGVAVTFDPKPRAGDWNGAGCHTNYSTAPMRDAANAGEGPTQAYGKIIEAIEKLSKNHQKHIDGYGKGNERRLTGAHETAPITAFSYGVANRGCSVRIPRDAQANKYGYFEDRRPASNMDPYIVTKMVVETTCS
jgi:glutamine synthetase